ncbi:MAG: class III poly(R)-hydroxyalkanoic acid synthase subunit PhaC, partial [Candidatus Nitrosotenuis sp.]
MQSEIIDPKLVEEFLSFSKNVSEAPKLVPAPDEISLESTPYDVVYEQDKMRLLHYRPLEEKQIKTPLLISYA